VKVWRIQSFVEAFKQGSAPAHDNGAVAVHLHTPRATLLYFNKIRMLYSNNDCPQSSLDLVELIGFMDCIKSERENTRFYPASSMYSPKRPDFKDEGNETI
jgi:hypothetical protein